MSWVRLLNVGCRALHLVAVSALLGGCLWGVPGEALAVAAGGAVASGLGLLALEAMAGPVWLLEGRGLVVLVKLGLLALVVVVDAYRGPLLVVVMIVAAVGAHMPGRARHATWIPEVRTVGESAPRPNREVSRRPRAAVGLTK